ncbi:MULTISPECIES: prephenate dehydratase [unclassified Campylobacter]|uniref:prephenate dehydratase n=1 Tax=unclassified Campylobacter TaxID=2593542 RepID=UPI001BD9645C|nr:prephenate dehydratase [Campylobacter sp. RM12651]MBT0878336.1 prephenate dehydratase [Campylobacter sp. 2018MI01]MBT0880925.1 prephenate dehydratase [Campylobacter sp. 2018MI27]MBT0881987.1 prephenate dehydratase [Campylobacter sp. 2018MI13]MBT0883847.1 prephenate dehydratase [Campylobacter sp. 2018MI10]MBZ7975358.1 prephenate dehydratase [Campylobacter sp. RM12637]MBZ7977193.1 prephenate dehydratase [Campylobacter sp. RM12654]MBZ7981705.1 prephenate dehydratase [Campylobacter sp. RM1264
MMNLEEIRQNINKIDDEIIKLLNQRMEFVKQVGILKHNEGSPIYRPVRENEIINRLSENSKGLLEKDAIKAIYQEIFAISRNLELPQRVAFLGPIGTYTHQAARLWFGALSEYIEIATIEDVFVSLNNDEVSYAVVPIENNTEGGVGATLDCLAKYDDILIFAENYLDIHHSFASTTDDIRDIKVIFSHPQGYNQCKKFLEAHNILDIEFVPTKSTAAAAKLAKDTPNSAAICSKIAAKLSDLPLMFECIEDNKANKTRFLVLSKHSCEKSSNSKTSILANTAHKAGALVDLLNEFKEANINLTKIESRPLKKKEFEYSFFIDFDGHIDDLNVQKILKNKTNIKWLGSYLKNDK